MNPSDVDAANRYVGIRNQLGGAGQPNGEMDMMIAAHALSAGAVLVANNSRHYVRVEASHMLENWV